MSLYLPASCATLLPSQEERDDTRKAAQEWGDASALFTNPCYEHTDDPSAECNGSPSFWEEKPPFPIKEEYEFSEYLLHLPLRHSIPCEMSYKERQSWKFMTECKEGDTFVADWDGDDEGISILYYVRKDDFFIRKQFEIYLSSVHELVPPVFTFIDAECQQKMEMLMAQFQELEGDRERKRELMKRWVQRM